MRHRRRVVAVVSLSLVLVLGPTTPLFAQPAEDIPGIGERVTEWITGLARVLLVHASSGSEAYPILDPNGQTSGTEPLPDSQAQEVPPDSGGETHPYLDPHG